jgi:hypothetical protein
MYLCVRDHVFVLGILILSLNEEMPISDKHGCCGFDIISNKMTAQHVYKTKVDHLMKLMGGSCCSIFNFPCSVL